MKMKVRYAQSAQPPQFSN